MASFHVEQRISFVVQLAHKANMRKKEGQGWTNVLMPTIIRWLKEILAKEGRESEVSCWIFKSSVKITITGSGRASI